MGDAEERAERLRSTAAALAEAADDDLALLGEYGRTIDLLAAVRGGPGVARQQMLALMDRLYPEGCESDPEGARDYALLEAAIANL